MSEPITIYTRPNDLHCKLLKRELERRGVQYTEIDLTESPDAKAEMLRLTGGRDEVPVMVEGEKVTVGIRWT